MLMAMALPMTMVMGCHSPCELWDLDAIHHANGNGNAIPCGSLMLMLMLMVLGMVMRMAMQMVLLMAIHP